MKIDYNLFSLSLWCS